MDAANGVVLGTCASGCETYPLTPTVRRCICRWDLPGGSGRREFPSGTDTIINLTLQTFRCSEQHRQWIKKESTDDVVQNNETSGEVS